MYTVDLRIQCILKLIVFNLILICGISDFGMLTISAAAYLVISLALMGAVFKWFRSMIDRIIEGNMETMAEYRAGSENSRAQEDGKCGYSATPILELSISVLTAHQAQTPCEECTDVSNMFNIYKDASGNYHIDFDNTTQNCGFDSLIIKLDPVYYVEGSNKEVYSEDYIGYQDNITSTYNIHHNRGLFAFGPFSYLIDKEDFRGQSDFCGKLDIRTFGEDAQVLVYLSLLGF